MELHETDPFEFSTHIRYSEVDHRAQATLPAIIDLFQDCSTFQSEVLGIGMEWLKSVRKGWVLLHWRILIDRRPRLYETVSVGTFASRFTGMTAERDFYLRDANGELIVKARSNWAFVDLSSGHPVKPTAEHVEPYGLHAPLELPPAPKKIALPERLEEQPAFVVRRHHIDTNGHMNNCQYVREALDLLPEDGQASQVRVDYRRAAVLGDTVRPELALEPDRTVVILRADNGAPFATVELR